MLTEAEAKTKWCPHVRYLATFRGVGGKLETAGSFNRGGADSGLEKSNCIGSACMMWRDELLRGAGRPDSYSGQGYCGLAGRPE